MTRTTRMTVIKINAMTVPADSGDELARRFAAHAGIVDDQDGFEGFELLKPTDERTTWLVVTRWRDEASFQAWLHSPAFGHGHPWAERGGGEAPAPVVVSTELWCYEVAGGSPGCAGGLSAHHRRARQPRPGPRAGPGGVTGQPFGSDVVAAVSRHMNDDHAADCLLICRTLGGRPDATAAAMTGMDATGIEFTVTVGDADETVRVPFSRPLSERAEVRPEVVRMYRDACAAAGVAPRPAAPH